MKTLTMYRPNVMQNALSDFDRYLESFFGDSVFKPASRVYNQMPAVDIRETEKAYLLEMELPGYDEKDIDINIDGGRLTIVSKQECAKDEQGKNPEDTGTWILRERSINSFSRSFKLPENANSEDVSAEFKNGILSLEIKKRAEALKRTIKINAK